MLLHDQIENFFAALRLSLRANGIIRQNLFIWLGTVIVMMLAAILGLALLTLGVLAYEGGTVFVCLNGLRLLVGTGSG
ncbi:MAG: hypothetical protein PHQ04_09830 [Opitutaceae bacterium]|nr:hypothetical protein [Opitutaceae bacterium]